MMVVSFMSAFTHSTGTRHQQLHPRKCVGSPPWLALDHWASDLTVPTAVSAPPLIVIDVATVAAAAVLTSTRCRRIDLCQSGAPSTRLGRRASRQALR
jgi:hypothetical protein